MHLGSNPRLAPKSTCTNTRVKFSKIVNIMIERIKELIDDIQELIQVPNVDKNADLALIGMKQLQLIVELRNMVKEISRPINIHIEHLVHTMNISNAPDTASIIKSEVTAILKSAVEEAKYQ
jgi:hypothetical protein